ncbi:SGNH/GDSL hydrolase family protein [Streptomyces sp. NBC_00989]|uniref:SGNH/GDSL hydrolase family protein n=1 Tax=Streptomyces sp. NBC_00989 TaxID=2903705 RepID=UPI00386E2C8A|nr:SGNH/GDSL hydrolase family protein [Streptomyces sp. NBC_00989]
MGPLARTGMGVALACGVLVTAVSIGQSSDSSNKSNQSNNKEISKGPYVALGDSYTSGPKIPPQTSTPDGCDRSGRNYPALVAKELGLKATDFRDVSCSGATISDLTTPQSTGNGTNPAQLSALNTDTRLVTLGIGGNDIGFSSMITKCVGTGTLFRLAERVTDITDMAPCEEKYTSGGTDKVAQKIRTTGDRLTRALNEIQRRAPEARVYVVGYPSILPAKGTRCGRGLPIAPGDVTFLRQKQQELNTMLGERALAAGATYVDTFTPSAGHDACSPAATRWIEPLKPSSPAAMVHPNERGEQGMASAVLSTVKS